MQNDLNQVKLKLSRLYLLTTPEAQSHILNQMTTLVYYIG